MMFLEDNKACVPQPQGTPYIRACGNVQRNHGLHVLNNNDPEQVASKVSLAYKNKQGLKMVQKIPPSPRRQLHHNNYGGHKHVVDHYQCKSQGHDLDYVVQGKYNLICFIKHTPY
jgi:hypothetical protein